MKFLLFAINLYFRHMRKPLKDMSSGKLTSAVITTDEYIITINQL
jgi:hypothetical protein